MGIKENLFAIKKQINASLSRVQRKNAVKLVVVTKQRSLNEIRQVLACGENSLGESRAQELEEKAPEFPKASWHFIGHLQSNKAKTATELCSLIHSVDSLKLLRKINDAAREIDKVQEVLLEVNVSGEQTKHGFKEEELAPLLDTIKQLPFGNIRILGFMTMAPLAGPEKTRPFFKKLHALSQDFHLKELSMGMSNDFEVAVEEGATIVRIGTAIFGK